MFQNEKLEPTWYEKTLWNLYDCDKVAINLAGLPTVAYSGELDPQKQAADVMAQALKPEGIELTHIIGPKTKHAYSRVALSEVEWRMDALAKTGRNTTPDEVRFATYTLRYNRMHWLRVDSLDEHWTQAQVKAAFQPIQPGTSIPIALKISTVGVAGLTIDLPPGAFKFRPAPNTATVVLIDGTTLSGPLPTSDGSWRCQFRKDGTTWSVVTAPTSGLAKQHGLQGPIDDAFNDGFLFVRPTGKARSEAFAKWQAAEMTRAAFEWRRQFRGDAPIKNDTEVNDADIASSNLILWGDPESNAILKRLADKLPIAWRTDAIAVGDRTFPSADHALVAIYPNPLNPSKYIVLNSGFTYREYDYLNNARQVPKLPDWAVIDLKTPPGPRYPGKIVAADFFGERWELKPPHKD